MSNDLPPPPAYTDDAPPAGVPKADIKKPLQPDQQPLITPGPSMPYMAPGQTLPYVPVAGTSFANSPVVFHYRNPRTGEEVHSLLPPDHPEIVCLQRGEHIPTSTFGFLGILAAIVWFPLGVGLCLLDRRVKCQHCGKTLEDGLCH
ncbi:hypothetical protein MKEN_00693000 [Mycena kentingensis (nom. inval.)]|nr:hypothetical protein MKEN_00693000 [Mycena kentingensis (nom. inval.)]